MAEIVLLVGGGGREHAIAQALAESVERRPDTKFFACANNRNPGIANLADGFQTLDETDPDAVREYAEEVSATVAVVGPDDPLAEGVVDALEDAGIYAFGPRKADARIEWDKSFQRRFMRDNDIPGCPDFEIFSDGELACEYIDEYDGDLAVKPAGLTGGKGVRIVGEQVTAEEAKEYVRESDYDRVVLEEYLVGEEFTLQAFVANGDIRVTPAAHDHGRAFEGDEGPNTGGMGSFTGPQFTLPFMTEDDYDEAVEIIEATIDALDDYKGVLYGQFMLTAEGVKVVEFNARFGDPEAMNTLPALETDFLDIVLAARKGESLPELSFAEQATVCKYAVPEGYPSDPKEGALVEAGGADPILYYASVDERDEGIFTTTSRAFAYVGVGDTIAEAERAVDDAFAAIDLDGLRVRHDIAKPDLIQRRIDHLNELRE